VVVATHCAWGAVARGDVLTCAEIFAADLLRKLIDYGPYKDRTIADVMAEFRCTQPAPGVGFATANTTTVGAVCPLRWPSFFLKERSVAVFNGEFTARLTSADMVVGVPGTPKVGDEVMLASDFTAYGGARYGPLQPGDVGELIAFNDGSDQPFLVSFRGSRRWYHEQALQKAGTLSADWHLLIQRDVLDGFNITMAASLGVTSVLVAVDPTQGSLQQAKEAWLSRTNDSARTNESRANPPMPVIFVAKMETDMLLNMGVIYNETTMASPGPGMTEDPCFHHMPPSFAPPSFVRSRSLPSQLPRSHAPTPSFLGPLAPSLPGSLARSTLFHSTHVSRTLTPTRKRPSSGLAAT
jgi:hypothetical protein